VLKALCRDLQLDDAERAHHLFDLARTATVMRPSRRRPTRQRVRPAPATFGNKDDPPQTKETWDARKACHDDVTGVSVFSVNG
jgi:hypothetical protein